MSKIVIDLQTGKKYLVHGKEFHSNRGVIDCSNNGLKEVNGYKFIVLDPDFTELWDTKKIIAQSLTRKDIGSIITETGLSSGWKVLEIGTGSASLTMFLARLVGPNGKVVSIEKNKKHFEIAKKNLERVSLLNIVELRNIDFNDFETNEKFDLVFIDTKEPYKHIAKALKFLKINGYLVLFSIYMDEIKKIIETLEKNNIFYYKVLENFQREIIVTKNGTRPEISGLIHTGYIIVSKKI